MWRKVVFLFLISFCTNVLGNENYYLMLKNSKLNLRMGPRLVYPVKFNYKKLVLIDKDENALTELNRDLAVQITKKN